MPLDRASSKEFAQLDLYWHPRGETPKAICVSDNGTDKKWIPKSICAEWVVTQDKKHVKVTVEEWWARKEKLL